jgi:hypothetical protein
MPDNLPPEEQPSPFNAVVNTSAAFIKLAAQEWLPSLVNQPMKPPFEYDARFDNEAPRISRLLSTVVVILFILIGGLLLLDIKGAVINVIRTALSTVIVCFILALFFTIFIHIFRVRMSPPVPISSTVQKIFPSPWQILFAVIYTFVPWLPVFTFLVLAIFSDQVVGTAYSLAVVSFFVCSFWALYNYVKAMKEITNCAPYRIWMSALAPVVLLISFILFR